MGINFPFLYFNKEVNEMGSSKGTGSNTPNGINIPVGKLFIDDIAITSSAAELNLAATGLATGKFVVGEKFTVTYPQVVAADVAKTFFIAPAACKVVSAYERHVTVAGQAAALNIEKLTSGQAPSAGGVVLAATWDLTSVANTPVSKAAVVTAVGTLAAGDALCLILASGNAASYALGTITVTMQWV